MTAIPTITLNNGQIIPQLGFGVLYTEPRGNEKEVGEGIAKSGLDRTEVFVTSKLANDAHHPDDARVAFDLTLDALGSEYVDLFLIHWPLPIFDFELNDSDIAEITELDKGQRTGPDPGKFSG